MFQRILIANRGEIALRIVRACRELGAESVCVYSEEDRNSAYLEQADRAICIGPGAAAESYLKSDRIIAAAEVADADAIHPGYGFLAESADFAQQCRECKIEFIGPSADAMRLLGDKASARELAKKNKVPVVPGSEGLIESDEEAAKIAKVIGYPVLIKATAGGGGRGMRLVESESQLQNALSQARQEAAGAFKNEGVYIEKFVERPRHVEVQILADQQGHVVHLYERDCTVQRRHQKLMEESPSPGIDVKTRNELCRCAVKLAKATKYTTAATVEFLVSGKKFYFIEVNTRIQVEHPVTEMVTGIDLIKEQIRVAAGEPLSFTQKDVKPTGAAIELRINAEDPEHNFRPCAGLIEEYRPTGGFGVRLDTHVYSGYRISPQYDSMIAKLIVHQPTREAAIATLKRCLDELYVHPIKTTIPLFRKILNHADFVSGEFDTSFIDTKVQTSTP
jgi:acetyl-CoA carboxylase biotin carboxylase subunit